LRRYAPHSVALLVALLHAPAAHGAELLQTFVSSEGNNANDCSRAAPCQSFDGPTGALSKTIAGGVIVVLDSAAYGTVVINKSVSIIAEGVAAMLRGSDPLTVLAGNADVIHLRGLILDGMPGFASRGIHIHRGTVHVENFLIEGYTGEGGIKVVPTERAELYVSNTTIANSRLGVLVAPTGSGSAKVVLNNVQLENNEVGIRALGNAEVVVGNSVVSGNTVRGVVVNTGAELRLSNTMVTGNGIGLHPAGGALISFGNNVISGNTTNGAPTSTHTLR
jgi:hypothetical protein